MFRLHRNNKPSKSGEKIEFKFSHFKALQVPKGWDRLIVSVISIGNGKTIAKSSKSLVRDGNCQWPDTFSESLWVPRDNSSKEIEDCLLKLLVATGSSRSGILGEATISMTSYTSSSDAIPLSIPLNKCNHGTVLQVNIQCLTPSAKFRDEESRLTNSHMKGLNANNHDMSVKSNGSDCSHVESVESSSIKDLDSSFSLGEVQSRGTSFSGSASHCSYNSIEGSIARENFSSSINSRGDGQSPSEGQVSTSSQKGVSHCNSLATNSSQSNRSSLNFQIMGSGNLSCTQELGASSLKMVNSSKTRQKAAEDTIEELRAEAKMWEMNARKLMFDLDTMRTEFSDQSKNVANLGMELSAAYAERDNFRKEVEQLHLLLEDPIAKPKALEDSTFQGECVPEIEKALKDELKFQKESNANLSLQLKRSQESNIELVSVLQELEETIEQQKMEIQNLSALSSKCSDLENSLRLGAEANRNLMLQLQQLEESKKNLLVEVQQLEEALEDKTRDTESAASPNKKIFLDIETKYRSKLSAKEEEILSLKAQLSESIQERSNADIVSRNGDDADLLREIEILKEKVEELEMDCNELTNENLELLINLKEVKKNLRKGGAPDDCSPGKLEDHCFPSFEPKVSNNESQIRHLEDTLQGKVISNINDNEHISIQELESMNMALGVKVTELNNEVTDKTSQISKLEASLLSKEKDIEILRMQQSKLEAKVCRLQNDNIQLEEDMEIMLKERDINSKCSCDLRNDLATLSRSMDSHVSANRVIERKSLELENQKHELELQISDIEQEREQLSNRISVLEAQLRDIINERESNLSELENSKSQTARLQEEIKMLKSEIDSSKDVKRNAEVTHLQWSEAQQECEYLRRANQQLQTVIENITEECSSIQSLNGDLRKQKLELQEYCTVMETRLRESEQKFADCSERVELLERKYNMMLEENACREKLLTSELDMLLEGNRKQMEQGQSLLNQIRQEKTVEIQNLQQEIEHLSMKLSATYEEKERTASNSALEISALRSDKAKLNSSLEEVQSKLISFENEADVMQTEREQKLQELTTELADFKINWEILMADHEKLLKLVEEYKSREAKFKGSVNALELKLTVAEYERQKCMEESGNLKIQLQQMQKLENETKALKNELNSINSDRERLEASLHATSELCEYLKAENNSSAVKVLSLEKAVSELEDCKRSRAALQERILKMESDLKAKESLFAQDAEQKNEFSHIKRMNRQYEQTIQLLEQEKNEFLSRARSLEEELKLIKEQKRNQISKANRKPLSVHEGSKVSKNHMVKTSSPHRNNRKKPSLKNDSENVKDQQDISSNKHQNEIETEFGPPDESIHPVGVDPVSKIQFLEIELAKAKEANNIYEVQLKRFKSQGKNNLTNAPLKSMAEGELVTKEKFERTKSMLEAELRDIQERYLDMSLKYAEVEAQREELVMKLRVAKNHKG